MNRFAALAIAIILVVGASVGAWFYFAGEIRRSIELLAQNDGTGVPRLTCGRLDMGGFPFRFDVICTDATVQVGDVTTSLPLLEATALVYRLNHILANARGPAKLVDAFTGARNELHWDSLEASLRFGDNRIERLSIVAGPIMWLDVLTGEALIAQASGISIQAVDIPERFVPEAMASSLALYAETRDLVLPAVEMTSGSLAIQAELDGLHPAMPTLSQPEAMRLWQQLDGGLRLVSLSATDGMTSLSADGELAATDTGLIDGHVRIQSQGVIEQISPLLPTPFAGALFGAPAEDGSYSQTLNIRGGVILAGLVPVGMMPPLF